MIMMAFIGEARMRELTDAGALDTDPLLSTILVFMLFGFFAKFWTHGGQTLGMQVWGFAYKTQMAAPSACGRHCCALLSPSPPGCAWAWVSSGY